MKLNPKRIQPANGKYLIKVIPPDEKTSGGLLLPQVTDAAGRPLTSIQYIPLGLIIAVGGPASKGSPNQQMPEFNVQDTVILSGMPQPIVLDGDPYIMVDFYQVIGKVL